jgi:hypothetical protein
MRVRLRRRCSHRSRSEVASSSTLDPTVAIDLVQDLSHFVASGLRARCGPTKVNDESEWIIVVEAELRLQPPPAGRAGEFENLLGRRDARVETFMPRRRRFGLRPYFRGSCRKDWHCRAKRALLWREMAFGSAPQHR